MSSVLIVGGGPSAAHVLSSLSSYPDEIWTCNRALIVYPACHVFLCADPRALDDLRAEAARSRRDYGTELVTRRGANLHPQQTEIDYTTGPEQEKYSRTMIAGGRSIGVIAAQLACQRGFKAVHLVGFDGYAPDAYTPHENKKCPSPMIEGAGRDNYWREMNRVMQSVLHQLIADRADVKFIWYAPKYLVPPKLPNVEVIPC